MKRDIPTPKTLTQAIRDGLADAHDESKDSGEFYAAVLICDGPRVMTPAIVDFLAQKFSVAMICAETPDEADRLQTLFKLITKKEAA